jgi:serine/threonine protein phosphatase 1
MNSPSRAGRTIVIGDVHGCSAELQDLLQELAVSPRDRLISVGDLLCKGPDSRGVLEWAMKAENLSCVLGNHELRFLSAWRRGTLPNEKAHDAETCRQLGSGYDAFMRFIETWPLSIARKDCLVVHAGFDPRRPGLTGQSAELLTNIRRLEDTRAPWYEAYEGKRLVVFGHWARREPVVRDNAIGLDTGCVYGGRLTALILPERRLVSVPARAVYQAKESWDEPAARALR